MKTMLQRIGNSRGIIIPKAMLAHLGLEDEVELVIEDDALVIRKAKESVRTGWAAASQAIAAAGDDALVWPEFPNDADPRFEW